MAAKKRSMSRAAVSKRAAHKAKVHASPAWAEKKAKVKATHAAKVKAKSAVKRPTGGSSGPSQPPKGFTSPAPPIGRTSSGTGGPSTSTGAANRARQGSVTGAAKRVGGDRIGAGVRSKGVAYKKPSKAKRLKV